jgi:polar amino acid transport system substrate-binding protein
VTRRSPATLAVALLAFGAGACGGGDRPAREQPARTATAVAAESCAKDRLALKTPGRLTVATDKPAYPPYFVDGDPTNGSGFESALAYAVADRLGFDDSEVRWTVVPFNASLAPGRKRFDFDVNQISITLARARRVDFSTPYYTAPQAVVALKRSPASRATSLAALKGVRLGVQVGTTSLDAVMSRIRPTTRPQVFDDSDETVRALRRGRVDAVVIDLPTAFYLTSQQIPSATIAGQFDAPGGDDWGMLLEKGSKLTRCVDRALAELDASGELLRITDRWMGRQAGAPALE